MTDLSTTYLGLTLKNPLVASASPLTKKIEGAQRLEEAGAGAIVMYSLFEEQIIHESLELDHYLTRLTDSFAEAQTYLPDLGTYPMGPDKYLDHLSAIKAAVSVPVIASLNGVSKGGWVRYARFMQDAGADALELNMYYLSGDPDLTGQELEDTYVDLVAEVKAAITIPLAVKLSPFITSLPHFAGRLAAAGADGLIVEVHTEPGAVQPLLSAGLRPGRVGSGPHAAFERFRGPAPAVALDFNPARQSSGRPGIDERSTFRARRAEGHDGWRQSRHDGFHDPPGRLRASIAGIERPECVDG